jgi:hypothetical protein
MTVSNETTTPYDVGYGKPPRHTQFRKGRSGNPGGRPRRREEVERLKALTLAEAYRGVVLKREDGVAMPALAIEAILRSQIELAMNGDVRAQRDILNAVRAYERADAETAALDAYGEELVRQAADLEVALKAIEQAKRAAPVAKSMSYAEAAERIKVLLKSAAESETAGSETCATGKETVTEETDAERNAPPPSADRAPQPENNGAPAAPPVAPPPSAPSQPPPDRHARRRAREATFPPGADSRAGRLHNRLDKCLRHRTGHSAQPFDAIRKEVTSRHSRRQKSGDSPRNSLFSGNRGGRSSFRPDG